MIMRKSKWELTSLRALNENPMLLPKTRMRNSSKQCIRRLLKSTTKRSNSPADKNVGGLLLPILLTLRLIRERSWIIKMMIRNLHRRNTSHFGSRCKKAFSWGLTIARTWSSICKKTLLSQEKERSQSHPNLRLLTGISSNKPMRRASISLPKKKRGKNQPEILRLDLWTTRCLPPSASFLRWPKGIRPRSRSSHSLGRISLKRKIPANQTPSKPDLWTRRYLRCSNLSQSWINQTKPR